MTWVHYKILIDNGNNIYSQNERNMTLMKNLVFEPIEIPAIVHRLNYFLFLLIHFKSKSFINIEESLSVSSGFD